jgi:hypothetical protein
VQKLSTDHVGKLIACQHHIVNLRGRHDYLLGQTCNAAFCDMPANTTDDTKSVLFETTGHEKLRISVMLLVLADGRKFTPFVTLKRKNLVKY